MRTGRTALLAVASLTLLATAPLPAAAASSGMKDGVATVSADELSSRARQRQVRHYRRGINPGAAAFGAIAGTVGGIIATEQANRYYRRQYAPYGAYGYGAPYGYAPSYGYGYAPSYGYGGYGPSYYAPY